MPAPAPARADGDVASPPAGDDDATTSARQTFLALLKGYVGPGCLSLPWAVSRVGLAGGTLAIFAMCLWTSFNCWTLVATKRHIVAQRRRAAAGAGAPGDGDGAAGPPPDNDDDDDDDDGADGGDALTYPDVGGWAYGEAFADRIAACICVQQLAICTVFFSFVGENIRAVCELVPDAVPAALLSHTGVITAAVPLVLGLALVPNLRVMAPVIALATALLLAGLGTLAYVALVAAAGEDGPPTMPAASWREAPLALCAVLYSYEGVCLILPVEMAMAEPRKFRRVFTGAMVCVASIFAAVSALCVYAFGEVTNGSVTAFLLEKYKDDDALIVFLMIANTLVSLSVLFTYPLQLFPTLELVGPKAAAAWGRCRRGGGDADGAGFDLAGFAALPALPEQSAAAAGPPDADTATDFNEGNTAPLRGGDSAGGDAAPRAAPPPAAAPGRIPGDSCGLRMGLVLLTYAVAVVVPNVQVLISLAGAVAGSSVALLIPPLIELARLERLAAGPDAGPPADVAPLRRVWGCGGGGKFAGRKFQCVALFWMGFVFMIIGAGASIYDILGIWFE